MKRRISMKFLFRWSLLVVIVSGHTIVSAQKSDFLKEGIYFDNYAYTRNVENTINDLLKVSNTHLDTTETKKQLQEKAGATVTIQKHRQLTKKLSGKEMANHLNKRVVAFNTVYDCGNCNRKHINPASGYIIDPSGIIVTNHHVVESFIENSKNKNLAMVVSTFDGKVYFVTEILATDEASDLCVVKIDTRGDKLEVLPLGKPAEQGDDVYVMSNPNQMLFYFTKGIVARNYMSAPSRKSSKLLPSMDITADYAAGSSGAAIVDQYGNLVSTVSSTRSIYYYQAEQKNLQMVVKQTKPVVLLNKLVRFK